MQPNAPAAPANADPNQFGQYSNWAQQEMAKGFTPDQLHQTLQQRGITDYNQPEHSGNFFTHLLPTVGGILGGIGGGILTAGLGGEVAGGAGGAALGKALENSLEGKKVIQGNDLTAGLEGAVGNGVGGIVGRGLSKGAELLGNRAAGIASQEAATKGAQDAIDTAANTYKDVSPQYQQAINANDSLAHATNMGFDVSDPANLVKLGDTSNDVLNAALDKALADSGPIDLAHYPQIVKDALAKEAGTLGSYDKVALSRGRFTMPNTPAGKLLSQLEDLGAGVAKSHSDPNEIRTLTSKLGDLAADAKPSVTAATGAVDPSQRAIYNVLNDVRGQIKDALYNRPEVNAALKGIEGNLTAEDVGTQQLADHLNGILTAAGNGDQDAQTLLSEISRNINVKKLGQAGQNVGQIVTSTGAKARAAAQAGLGEAGSSSNPVLDMAGTFVNPHASILTKAAQGAAHAATNPAVLATLSRIGSLGSKLAPAAGTAIATAPNLGADPTTLAGGGMTNTNDTMGTTMQSNGNSYQDLINAMGAQAVLAPNLGGGAASFMGAVAPQLQRNQLISGELSAIPGSFANAGGAQGTGGILSRISALIPGTAAHTYQQQQSGAAQALASALGISPEAAAGLLPQLMQNQNTAGMNGGILSNLSGQLAY